MDDDQAALHLDDENPWPGPASYTEASRRYFHGRDADTAELLRLIRLTPFVTLYGKSGLGKSSMLQAGLFPQLRAARFLPVYLRLDYAERTAQPLLAQAALRLRQEIDAAGADAPQPDPGESLWAYLQRRDRPIWTADNFPLTPVLVFDQFEEVFSKSGSAAQVKAVLECMADLVGDRMSTALAEDRDAARRLNLQSQQYRVVLSFRSEFLADVESWERQANLPKRDSLHLTALSRERAIDAVQRAGAAVLEPGVATQIVDFVLDRDSESGATRATEVEPVLLSLCCFQLNSRRERPAKIDAALLRSVGDDILEDFYAQSLAGLRPEVSVFIEDNLIQGGRYRSAFPRDVALGSGALTSDELDTLMQRRLLRVDPQGEVPRIELIHDRIVGVVREARDRRLARDLHARQLLQAEEDRRARERDADARRQAERAEAAERERARVARWRNGLAAALLLLSIATGWLVYFARDAAAQKNNANNEAARALAAADLARANAERALRAERLAVQSAREAQEAAGRTAVQARIAEQARRQAEVARQQAEVERARARVAEDRAITNGRRADALRLIVESDAMLTGARGANDTRAFQQILAAIALHSDADVVGSPFDALTARQHLKRFAPVTVRDDSAMIAVAFSPDGRTIATGHADGSVALRSIDTPATVRVRARQHTALVQSVVFSHDGRRLLSGSDDGTARQWNVDGLSPYGDALTGHTGPVYSAAYDRDDATIVTGSRDGTVRLWDATSGRPVHAPVAMESGIVWGVAVRPTDGSIAVATGAPDNPPGGAGKSSWLTLLDGSTLAVKGKYYAHSEDTTSVAFSPDGSSVVTGGADDALRRRDLTGDASQSTRMVGHSGNVQSVAFSADGRYVASASIDKTVRLWLAATGQPLGGPLGGHDEAVTSVVFSPDGQWLASASDDGRLILWSLDPSWTARAVAGGNRGAGYGGAVGAIAPDGTAGLFVQDGALRHRSHDGDLFDPAIVPGPPFYACPGSGEQTAQRSTSNRKGGGDARSTAASTPAAYAPDGRSFVSGHVDGSLHRWDTSTWQPVGRPIAASACAIDAVAWSADGRVIVAASRDRALVFDAHAGTAVASIPLGNVRRATALALSADGRWLAAADAGPAEASRTRDVPGLVLHDLRDRAAKPRPFQRPPAVVSSLALSPDGRFLISGDADGQVLVWLRETGVPVGKPVKAVMNGSVTALAFLPDDKRFVSGSRDGSTRPWPAPNAWASLMCEKVSVNLSRRKWSDWVSRDVPYRCACPDLPIEADPGAPPGPLERCTAPPRRPTVATRAADRTAR